ncbi:DNA topoisomerase [Terfezia boudieri ATCC MYA-4762]|uniref:DNA topoisomerase n=1 Tax=Terfezia boudieri ATCC MYA-4762 TaxID=1051890 RepID=A0A3N4LSW5_9PEZI|nr:DNA topoisomerase [Terfezia boudieri ATCC MYA-4762]
MPRVFLVAEKPSIAKAVALHLSGDTISPRNTGQKYIKNYDFTFRFPASLGGECHATMSSVIGHTVGHDFEPGLRKWNSCGPEVLFDSATVKFVDEDKKPIARNIETEARRSTHLFIWTDCDREGEYIGTEIRDIALKVNPRLTVKRARFNNIERAHVIEAAMNPVDIDELQASAVAARIELDLRIGAAFTRFQTLSLQNIPGLEKRVLSYGSCQFPTLGFVVDRYWRVVKFVPEKFWGLKVVLEKDGKEVTFSWRRVHLFDKGVVIVLYERCMVGTRKVRVEAVDKKATRKWYPLPLTTVELQKQGSRFLGLSSQVVMTIAEKLYTSGFISYPRTETDMFDPAINLQELIKKQTTHPTWGPYASSLLNNNKFSPPRKGTHNDKAHPPIHPVAMVAPTALSSHNECRVYEFVCRRFLACCSEDALGETTTIDITWGAWPPPERFRASGLVVKERNYLDVYIYDGWSTHEVPEFREGEEIVPKESGITEGQTSRPGFLTEPELIGLMDLNGIGTDATMAEHIAKVVEREYVFAQPRGRGGGGGDEDGEYQPPEFLPSTLGIALVMGYDQMNFPPDVPPLTKPFLRKEMEAKMKAICEGRLRQEDVVRESLDMYRRVFAVASREVGKLRESCNRFLGEGGVEDE